MELNSVVGGDASDLQHAACAEIDRIFKDDT